MTALILAAADLRDEPELVAAASQAGVQVSRRSVDAADLLAAAAVDRRMPVVLTAGMPRLTGDLVGRLLADERPVIGLMRTDAEEAQLRAWCVDQRIRHAGDPAATMRAIANALVRDRGVWSIPSDPAPMTEVRGGIVIAVCGPSGAPGRTTTAIALGEAYAARGIDTCLVDADLRAPAMIAQLGVVDDASGLVIACRHADNGTLSAHTLRRCTNPVQSRLSVLGGIPRADRWADVREAAARTVWATLRATFTVTVIDVGGVVEGETGSDLLTVRRDAAGATALEAADHVVAVARATSLGLVRLLNEAPMLPREPELIVLTGARVARDGVQVLRAGGIATPCLPLTSSAAAQEQAVRAGHLPREASGRRERRQLDAVVDALAGATARAGRRRGRRP